MKSIFLFKKRNKINHWDFILKIADDYLTFLRNLMPIALFLSLSFLIFTEINFTKHIIKNIGLLFFGLMTLTIGLNAMIINLATFSRKVLIILHQVHNKPLNDSLSLPEIIRGIWQASHFKQLLFLLGSTTMAMVIVIIYGLRYAFEFYRLITN